MRLSVIHSRILGKQDRREIGLKSEREEGEGDLGMGMMDRFLRQGTGDVHHCWNAKAGAPRVLLILKSKFWSPTPRVETQNRRAPLRLGAANTRGQAPSLSKQKLAGTPRLVTPRPVLVRTNLRGCGPSWSEQKLQVSRWRSVFNYFSRSQWTTY